MLRNIYEILLSFILNNNILSWDPHIGQVLAYTLVSYNSSEVSCDLESPRILIWAQVATD